MFHPSGIRMPGEKATMDHDGLIKGCSIMLLAETCERANEISATGDRKGSLESIQQDRK